MYKILIIAIVCLLPLKNIAQTVSTGAVFDDSKKSLAMPGVTVKNLNNKRVTFTRKDGKFTIGASVGDLLEFSYIGYHTDTLYLTNLLTKIVYLPVRTNSLRDVNVEALRLSKGILNAKDSLAEQYTLLSTGGNLARKRNGDKIGGLSLNLGYGKYRRDQRKEAELEERDRYFQEIDENFNEKTIGELVSLTKEEMKSFIVIYRPSVEKVKSERPFRYNYYIAEAYNAWLKLKPEERKLKDLPFLKSN